MDNKELEYRNEQLDRTYGGNTKAPAPALKAGERKQLIEEKLTYLDGAARAMQNELVTWEKKYAKFFDECLNLYHLLNKPDVLFDDSPLSRNTMNRWIRLFLIKKNMAFIAKETFWIDSPGDIPDFLAKVRELKGWALRFANDDLPEKTGTEKILHGGN